MGVFFGIVAIIIILIIINKTKDSSSTSSYSVSSINLSSSIIGKWRWDAGVGSLKGAPGTAYKIYQFNENNTYYYNDTFGNNASGNYEISENQVTLDAIIDKITRKPITLKVSINDYGSAGALMTIIEVNSMGKWEGTFEKL